MQCYISDSGTLGITIVVGVCCRLVLAKQSWCWSGHFCSMQTGNWTRWEAPPPGQCKEGVPSHVSSAAGKPGWLDVHHTTWVHTIGLSRACTSVVHYHMCIHTCTHSSVQSFGHKLKLRIHPCAFVHHVYTLPYTHTPIHPCTQVTTADPHSPSGPLHAEWGGAEGEGEEEAGGKGEGVRGGGGFGRGELGPVTVQRAHRQDMTLSNTQQHSFVHVYAHLCVSILLYHLVLFISEQTICCWSSSILYIMLRPSTSAWWISPDHAFSDLLISIMHVLLDSMCENNNRNKGFTMAGGHYILNIDEI